jgi:DNA-binding transcriptional regulator/RsmH inhibitor MraZ
MAITFLPPDSGPCGGTTPLRNSDNPSIDHSEYLKVTDNTLRLPTGWPVSEGRFILTVDPRRSLLIFRVDQWDVFLNNIRLAKTSKNYDPRISSIERNIVGNRVDITPDESGEFRAPEEFLAYADISECALVIASPSRPGQYWNSAIWAATHHQ